MTINKPDTKQARREFIKTTVAGAISLSAISVIPSVALGANKTLKVGMNIPMTGDYAPWGLPGLYGCEIVANNINSAGGVEIGDEKYDIEIASYDHAYSTEKAVQGFKKLVLEDEAQMVMMLGGSTVASVLPWATRKKVLTTTLLPSDITPDSDYLIATCESHPLYNVTGVEWLKANHPDVKTAAIVTNNDVEYGLQSAATYKAAFEVAGIDVIDVNLHGFDVTDFAPIVSSVLAKQPDVFCMATSFYVTPIMEQLFHQGYKGKVISCTFDYYDEIIKKTSKEFVNGTIFQFPDFDDPKLLEADVNFPDPGGFYDAFIKDHPNDWSAVAWEYPAILLNWLEAAKLSGSVEAKDIMNTLKSNEQQFVFGGGKWWGSQLWGLDNALVGRWPVVKIEDGKARIQEYGDVAGWLEKNKDVLIKHMKELGLRTV
ncbi:MAG: ABC transporter substrate-binding protein [Methyloligellaceae bacterium]